MSDEFAGSFYENLRTLVTLVDHLRDSGLQKYIKLPRIAVLGTQSSGKSSVLESIVGLDFLPRGEGVCTRRPLELRMVNIPEKSPAWAKFENDGQTYTDFPQVRRHIDELTDQVAGHNKGILDDPIALTIYSNTCPDLTVIDLPGITRIPLQGSDQPEDIEKITKEMAYRYVSDPRTIILCVIPANADISTSEALQMAKKVDPSGIRTICVITKIDIMDRGTSAKKLLLGQEVAMRLGYVGVKLRSQADILENVTVKQALLAEKLFFQETEPYCSLPPGYTGTQTLSEKLTKILFTHIKSFLPDIMKEVAYKIRECEERIRELGPSAPVDPRSKTQLLWNMINDYVELYKNTIRGKYDRRQKTKATKDLQGGQYIRKFFGDLLLDYTGDFQATAEYSDEYIKAAIQKHEGDTIPGFPSSDVFLYLVQPVLERLKDPVLECLSEVHSYLEGLSHKIIERTFFRFPTLSHEVSELASHVLLKEKDKTSDIIEAIIDSEEGYCFTNDTEYLDNRTDILPKTEGRMVDPQQAFVNEIRARIDAYFTLVIRNIRDCIPKSIGHFMVRCSIDNMQMELYNHINKNEEILNHLSEPGHISAEREQVRTQLDTLRSASKLIKRDPSLAAASDSIESEIKREQQKQKEAEEKKKAEPTPPPPPKVEAKPDTSLFGAKKPAATGEKKTNSLFGQKN